MNAFNLSQKDGNGLSTVVMVLLLFGAMLILQSGTITAGENMAAPSPKELQAQIDVLKAQVAALQELLPLVPYVSVDPNEINGLSGPHILFTGVNVHIRNGLGSTPDISGLGNLIIGYNETDDTELRTGSHNLVMGNNNSFRSYGGFVGGNHNTISGALASITGGYYNMASGINSLVSGGAGNTASGYASWVWGSANTASGDGSSVIGGFLNTASGENSSVCGGAWNTASGTWSSVTGGGNNTASGQNSTVSGGRDRLAPGDYNWAAGSLFENQ